MRLYEKIKKITCVFIGHSRILDSFWGYQYCGRCGEQLGDTLGGCFVWAGSVNLNCGCEQCQKDYPKLTWKDRLFVKKPEWVGDPGWKERKRKEAREALDSYLKAKSTPQEG